ncbi:hypothetical protein CVT26_001613 [Gymnopilus dilepis]|uniref:Arrestin-like N-terminal domain-containing protein n=1 Tax=Gymnopilus dilepis TaxID=231916 RepID=A0A409VSN6_9AGAR|nr:hypothetical protein CVT26_001613 [Gymnopilus dilepis]
MASSQALPEPMNAQTHHPKVKVAITLPDPTFVAGAHVSGKMEVECRADRGLGIGIMMVELFAIQGKSPQFQICSIPYLTFDCSELTSRDHSATSTFLHSRRLFQGEGLPPSNAVQAHPLPGDPPLPQHYYQARRGRSTFLFRIPVPASSPSAISFGSGLAKVRYELRASVGVFWKNEKRLVIDKHTIDVVESYPYDAVLSGGIPEAIVVGEGGKIWMQGRVLGSVVEAGGIACLELQVKNHSNKKNTGLTLALTRTLYLTGSATGQQLPAPVQISDTLTTVPFRGPEYIIPPGAEGIANLVFDVPRHARGVRGGTLDGEEGGDGPRHTESLFEIRCKVEVRLIMGMGSKDILLEVPVEIIHPLAMPPPEEIPAPYAHPYSAPDAPIPPASVNPSPYVDYNAYYPAPPLSPAPGAMPVPVPIPYLDPTQNQVWLPPPPSIPLSHTPVGYPYVPPSPSQREPYPPPVQPFADPYYAPQSPMQPQQSLSPPGVPVGSAAYIPRPSSAGPVASASQVIPPMVPGLPPPSSNPLLPLPEVSHAPVAVTGALEPEVGKGERASRIARQLRMSSRNRSVSPQSHRYPLPTSLLPVNESYVADTISVAATAGASSAAPSKPIRIRQLPQPPALSRADNLSLSPPMAEAVVHSPRPQLTPKHSFTRDPVLGTMSKSERVEELEKMADEVGKKIPDLSGDLPKEGSQPTAVTNGLGISEPKPSENGVDVNKTLPGPPVPTGKPLSALPSRARADQYFASQEPPVLETVPLPSDQTPPTPALLAVLPSRRAERNELKVESGLDALERRLLAEVGTRKFDTSKDQRPGLKSILPIDTDLSPRRTAAIPIPIKSPEPLHDSAISSLTLAGGLAGDESDGEFDGRTHRAGSKGGSVDELDGVNGLHRHMRQKAEVGTPTKLMGMDREVQERGRQYDSSDEQEKGKGKEKSKEGRSSGKKKDRSAAKGRVAAWLGGIDPDVPPQEQVIPPSPSVLRNIPSPFEQTDDALFDGPSTSSGPVADQVQGIAPENEPQNGLSAAPNPRSSGFVSIATLKRETIQARPLIARDATVVEEARRVQNIWSSNEKTPVIPPQSTPLFLRGHPSAPAPMSIRTDRRVSPPSRKPPVPPDPKTKPLSYSAAARNGQKQDVSKAPTVTQPSPSSPNKTPPRKVLQAARTQALFPSSKPADPEVKYDVRSARGGRGGKVTAVANLWASGAISNREAKEKEVPKRLNTVVETPTPSSSQPPRTERKLFSAAVMTPAPPKQAPVASGSGAKVLKPATGSGVNASSVAEAQRRPDILDLHRESKPEPKPLPRKIPSATNLAPLRPAILQSGKGSQSSDALAQKRPATAMSSPYSLHGKVTPNSLSTPSSSEPNKLHNLVVKGVKPVIKGTSNPVAAVVSSSHAVPTLSSTASLARPASQNLAGPKNPRPIKLPALLSTPTLSSTSAPEPPRPVSPSKPTDLAFGQARLRDLIKKYQGQGQKT